MHRMFRASTAAPLVAILLATSLSGCHWFKKKNELYTQSAESRPLEVPPDLDSQSTTRSLVVPGAPSASPENVSNSAGVTPPSVAGGASDLHVADSVENTYQRVGLALERAQLGKVASKDDAAHSYAYDFDGAVVVQPAAQAHHWYSRVLHPFGGDKAKAQNVKASLRVNVSEEAGGSRVEVVSTPGDKAAETAAQQLLATLRERLS